MATVCRPQDLTAAIVAAFVHQVALESPTEDSMLVSLSLDLHLGRDVQTRCGTAQDPDPDPDQVPDSDQDPELVPKPEPDSDSEPEPDQEPAVQYHSTTFTDKISRVEPLGTMTVCVGPFDRPRSSNSCTCFYTRGRLKLLKFFLWINNFNEVTERVCRQRRLFLLNHRSMSHYPSERRLESLIVCRLCTPPCLLFK